MLKFIKLFEFKYNGVIIILLLLFLVRSALHLSVPMYSTMDSNGDAHVRVMEVWAHNYIPSSGTWFPLLHVLIRYSLVLYDNIWLSPRILAVIMSFILVIVLYVLTLQISGNKKIAYIAVFLFVINPLFSTLFTLPLSEPLFSVLFCFGLFLLFSRKYLLSLVFISCANALRYEGWYLLPVFIAYFIFLKKRPFKIVLFSLGYLIFPLYWFYINYQIHGSFLFFLTDKLNGSYIELGSPSNLWDIYNKIGFQNIFVVMWRWSEKLVLHHSVILLFAVYGLFGQVSKRYWLLLFMSFFLFLMLIIQRTVGIIEWYPDKYLYMIGIFAIPLSACGFFRLIFKIKGFFNSTLLNKFIYTCLLVFCLIVSVKDDYYLIVKENNIHPPKLSFFVQEYPFDQFMFTVHPDKYPFDRDFIMYFAKHKKYSALEFRDSESFRQLYLYDSQTMYITPIQFSDIHRKSCQTCVYLYSDSEYFVWRYK